MESSVRSRTNLRSASARPVSKPTTSGATFPRAPRVGQTVEGADVNAAVLNHATQSVLLEAELLLVNQSG